MSMPSITAVVYDSGNDVAECLASIVISAKRHGFCVRGLLEERSGAPERHRCDMALRLIGSDRLIKISQDRGQHAKGCRLDLGELTRAADLLAYELLHTRCDLLLINKFGKSECEGTGLRHLVAQAIEKNVPVIIGVPLNNLAAWRAFAGDLSCEFDVTTLIAAGDPFDLIFKSQNGELAA